MLEFGLLALGLLGAGAWWRAKQGGFFPSLPHHATLVRLAQSGYFQWEKPQKPSPPQAFTVLHIIEGGLSLITLDGRAIEWLFSDIQWVSEVVFNAPHTASVRLYIEHQGVWRVVTLHLNRSEMGAFMRLLRRVLPNARMGATKNNFAPLLFMARIAEQTLEGETTLGAEVGLYVLPNMLVILRDDVAHGKLALSGIRRVIALERDNAREGMVRLHSHTQTALFVLPQHETLAMALSELAHCPLEMVSRDHKEK